MSGDHLYSLMCGKLVDDVEEFIEFVGGGEPLRPEFDSLMRGLHSIAVAAIAERRASRAVARAVTPDETKRLWKEYCDAAVKLKIAVADFAEKHDGDSKPTPPALSPSPAPPS